MSADPVAARRRVRRLALQMLYQIEARGAEDAEDIRRSLQDAADDPADTFEGPWKVPAPSDPQEHEVAFERAKGAWDSHEQADRLAEQLAPDWPTHRQPALDRNTIRPCWFEMNSTDIPPKAAVNEAIELAKSFGTDRSKAFLNGVLDRMLRGVLKDSEAKGAPAENDDEMKSPTSAEID